MTVQRVRAGSAGLEDVLQKVEDVLHTSVTGRPIIYPSIPRRHPSRLHKQVFSPHPAGFFLPVARPLSACTANRKTFGLS